MLVTSNLNEVLYSEKSISIMNPKRSLMSEKLTAFIKILLITLAALALIETNHVFIATDAREVEGSGSCHWRELELCCVSTASLFQNPNGLPMTEAELKRSCEYLDESAECYETYGERCLTKSQYDLVKMFSGELFDIEEDFCDSKSEMRKQYMQHIKCYREVQKKYQKDCVADLQVALEPIHKLDGVGSRLSTGCCSFNRFKDCIMSKIESDCGEDAIEIIQLWLTRGFGNIVNMFCRSYDPEAEVCKKILPKVGTKPHNGRNTSAISRVISSYIGVNMNLS